MEQKEIKINCPEGFEIDRESSTFECIKFKPVRNKLPKTWEEFCETHPTVKKEYYVASASKISSICDNSRFSDDDRNLLPSEKLAEAMLALCQLIQLRDCYNDEWVPDWTRGDVKYSICVENDEIIKDTCMRRQKVLNFDTEEICEEFLKNFQDLIEIAKPLL